MSIGIADLKLKSVSFEARYSDNFLHWDRAGKFWTDMIKAHPDMKLITGEPGRTAFRLSSECELSVQMDRFIVMQEDAAPNLKVFSEVCEDGMRRVSNQFEITEFTRLGLRKMYIKAYPTLEDASRAVLETGLVAMPDRPQFGISATAVTNVEWRAVWADSHKGCNLQLRSEELIFELQLPLNWKGMGESVRKARPQLVWDVDYFTKSRAGVAQLNVTQWIAQASHAVNRDSDNFLRGLIT
jgi:hypothetical protein